MTWAFMGADRMTPGANLSSFVITRCLIWCGDGLGFNRAVAAEVL